MRIAIATAGRFHVLDLARELARCGEDVRIYSYVPKRRAIGLGLPATCYRSLGLVALGIGALPRFAPNLIPRAGEAATVYVLNREVIRRATRAEVFVCMSGLYVEAAHHMRKTFGARVWLERGSRHVLSQRELLGNAGPSDLMVQRELEGYALADRIVVPSQHAAESFKTHSPETVSKLLINPYGVDLEEFPARQHPPLSPMTILFVGAWSYRKGADVLTEAIRRLHGPRLLHAGGLADVPFPRDDPRFEHVGILPQRQLKDLYARAHVFVLPSREDGFGMVLSQALVSGLHVVCTTMTGGPDLAITPALAGRIHTCAPANAEALAEALSTAINAATDNPEPLAAEEREQLSWKAYGRRYHRALTSELRPTRLQL